MVRRLVLTYTSVLGPAYGSLVSSMILLAAPLVLLGAISPIAIRLLLNDSGRAGAVAGGVFCLSTVGSVAGAILTGFLLAPLVGTRFLVQGLACLLALYGGFGIWGIRAGVGAAAVLAAGFGFLPRSGPLPADGSVVFSKESLYGQITIVDFNRSRYLLISGGINSGISLESSDSVLDYINFLNLATFWRPSPERSLLVGLGGGDLAKELERYQGIRSDVIELDPLVAQVAQSHFGYRPSGFLWIADARSQIQKLEPSLYDLVVIDAFNSDRQPPHLATKEFFEETKRVMAKGAILALNTTGYTKEEKITAWECLYKTLASEFSYVRAFALNEDSARIANIIFFASDEPIKKLRPLNRLPAPVEKAIAQGLANEIRPDSVRLAQASVFSDDFPALDLWTAPAMLEIRRRMIRNNASILLN